MRSIMRNEILFSLLLRGDGGGGGGIGGPGSGNHEHPRTPYSVSVSRDSATLSCRGTHMLEDKQRLARRCLGGEACRAALLAPPDHVVRHGRLTRQDKTDGKRRPRQIWFPVYLVKPCLSCLLSGISPRQDPQRYGVGSNQSINKSLGIKSTWFLCRVYSFLER